MGCKQLSTDDDDSKSGKTSVYVCMYVSTRCVLIQQRTLEKVKGENKRRVVAYQPKGSKHLKKNDVIFAKIADPRGSQKKNKKKMKKRIKLNQ